MIEVIFSIRGVPHYLLIHSVPFSIDEPLRGDVETLKIGSQVSSFPSHRPNPRQCMFKSVDLRMPLRVMIDDLSCTWKHPCDLSRGRAFLRTAPAQRVCPLNHSLTITNPSCNMLPRLYKSRLRTFLFPTHPLSYCYLAPSTL